MRNVRAVTFAVFALLTFARCSDIPVGSDFVPANAPGGNKPSVSVSPSSSIVAVGQSLQLVAEIDGDHGPKKATWQSSDGSIVAVSRDGVVTGVKIGGPVVITAKVGNVVAVASVLVAPSATLTAGAVDSWNGTGTVTSSPPGLNCFINQSVAEGMCSAPFAIGSQVTVIPVPSAGSVLTRIGCGSDVFTPTCTFTMLENRTVFAQFMNAFQTLTVIADPLGNGGSRGSGVVTSTPAGINCTLNAGISTGACSITLPYGIEIRLLATADAGSVMRGMFGPCSFLGFDPNFRCGMYGTVIVQVDFDKP
jgi:hypothetical protein